MPARDKVPPEVCHSGKLPRTEPSEEEGARTRRPLLWLRWAAGLWATAAGGLLRAQGGRSTEEIIFNPRAGRWKKPGNASSALGKEGGRG